ncbi:GH1 family beta-glucosidase [Nocardioides sp. CER19]|uniref:GH1 family beta-glucosidase n=1 Tax=Nocardioides sp. CER19 TaxID=3038538 RepID=UPI00244BBBEE|nr:GH1 family beta-glucosidase [Nocardioides sp. CER19]MDH2415882.1 GH1 family beta-glucosidase [Nocardioides sp. CER19]
MTDFPALPPGFQLGTATASYQIEGAVAADGRGPSVWDTFCAIPGKVAGGDTGSVACDHYHRMPEDVALIHELGSDVYRFSISWPRVLPTGAGTVNAAGLDFYDRLVDALVAAGVTPAATLFHWDLPQALEETGGWRSRDTAQRMAEYAAVVAERLGDRVGMWMPLNEPVVVTLLGYALGMHAPGLSLGFDALPVAHHQLLAHGLSVQALRAAGVTGGIGIANNHTPVWPASASPEDEGAAGLFDLLYNRLFADPVLLGVYPEGFAEAMPGPVAEDLAVISTPLDWYGVNYYNPSLIGAPGTATDAAPAVGDFPVPADIGFEMRQLLGRETTDVGWPIVPEGLTEVLTTLASRYPALPPVWITESGCSFHDVVGADGAVHDDRRIAYHDTHLRAVVRAIDAGVDVRGYLAWSLLDNFEWAEGYRERFGLVHVDYSTLVRTPKDSFRWFQRLAASRP